LFPLQTLLSIFCQCIPIPTNTHTHFFFKGDVGTAAGDYCGDYSADSRPDEDGNAPLSEDDILHPCVVCGDGGASVCTCKECGGKAHQACAVSAEDKDDTSSVLCHDCNPAWSAHSVLTQGPATPVKHPCIVCKLAGAATHRCIKCQEMAHNHIVGCSVAVEEAANEYDVLCSNCNK
jgi:hypothetical protein